MKRISVTVEIRRRLCQEIELSDEQYEAFINGDIDELQCDEINMHSIFEECRRCKETECAEDTDYSICDENGNTIVPWDD